MKSDNILLDNVKVFVLAEEIKSLDKYYTSHPAKSPIEVFMKVNQITYEISHTHSMKGLQKYVSEGGGILPSEASKYISDLYFNATNQIN